MTSEEESLALLHLRIDDLEKLLSQRIHGGWNEIQARFSAEEKARDHTAKELARRLEDLNHAHQQAREKERDFLSRETFEEVVKSWEQWRAGEQEFRSQMLSERSNYVTREMLDERIETTNAKIDQAPLRNLGKIEHIQGRLAEIERDRANLQGRFWAGGVALSIAVIVVNWALRVLGK